VGKFAEKLASATPARQRAMLGNIHTLVESNQLEKYYKVLTNFDFLAAKVQHPEFGVQALIEDYDLVEDNNDKVKTLKLIQGALRLSAHILVRDGEKLAGQLWGRMQHFTEPEIQGLLSQAKSSKQNIWLRPLTTSLTVPGGRLISTFTGHSDSVKALAVTPNGKQVISGSFDKTIKVWSLKTGAEIHTLRGHSDSVTAIAVTPDGKQVISGSSDKTIKVWSLKTGAEIHTLRGHSDSVTAVAVTPDGKQVISGSSDKTIKVWSLATGSEIYTVGIYSKFVSALAITPNGKQVISGSFDKTIKIWSLETGLEIYTPGSYSKFASALAIIPDDKPTVLGSFDETIDSLESRNREGNLYPDKS